MASGGAGASSGAARQVSADLVSLSQAAKHRLPPVTQAAERALLTLRSLQRSGEPLRAKDFLTPFLLAMREPAADTSILLHAMGAVHRQVTLDTVQAKSVPELLQAIREQANHADQSIQLKVLQVLPLLLGRLEYPVDAKFIHDSVDTLLLMRRSHSGPVMQQTASATLHQ
ncbi:MON2, partial [Symbiodinium sp. KB8]